MIPSGSRVASSSHEAPERVPVKYSETASEHKKNRKRSASVIEIKDEVEEDEMAEVKEEGKEEEAKIKKEYGEDQLLVRPASVPSYYLCQAQPCRQENSKSAVNWMQYGRQGKPNFCVSLRKSGRKGGGPEIQRNSKGVIVASLPRRAKVALI